MKRNIPFLENIENPYQNYKGKFSAKIFLHNFVRISENSKILDFVMTILKIIISTRGPCPAGLVPVCSCP